MGVNEEYSYTSPIVVNAKMQVLVIILCWFYKLEIVFSSKQSMWLDFATIICKQIMSYLQQFYKNHGQLEK